MTILIDPIAPTQADTALARDSARFLASSVRHANGSVRPRVEEPGAPNEPIVVPSAALDLFIRILNTMADGNTVRVVPGRTDLTTGDIAELLNCSRPHVIKLLDEGRITSHMVGTHRRARLQHVLAYRREHYNARKEILDQMSAMDQALGLI